jgi:hypothetical protein
VKLFSLKMLRRWYCNVLDLKVSVMQTKCTDNRDGPVSIIYIIIAGIELYNNNGWSIIIFILYIRGYAENLA